MKQVTVGQKVVGSLLVVVGVLGLIIPFLPGIILIIIGFAVFNGRNIGEAFDDIKKMFTRKRK